MAIKRLQKEHHGIQIDCPVDYCANPMSEEDLFRWTATINGPVGSPYEGGMFFLDITVPPDYPFKAPSVPAIRNKGIPP